MTFQARIALFDNSAAQALNDRSPVMTGKLEIPAAQIMAMAEELDAQDEQSYGDRKYKVIDLSVWESDGSSSLVYSGKASMPQKRAPITREAILAQQQKLAQQLAQLEGGTASDDELSTEAGEVEAHADAEVFGDGFDA